MAIYTVALDFFKNAIWLQCSCECHSSCEWSILNVLHWYINSKKKRKENRSKKKHQELINKDLGQLVENYLVLERVLQNLSPCQLKAFQICWSSSAASVSVLLIIALFWNLSFHGEALHLALWWGQWALEFREHCPHPLFLQWFKHWGITHIHWGFNKAHLKASDVIWWLTVPVTWQCCVAFS